METFFVALGVLLVGGILPLCTHRVFDFMKVSCIAITMLGCALGLVAVLGRLGQPAVSASIAWLHLFSLTFSIDSLSAFFLLPIFLVCPLTALYSFHYMNKPWQSGRTAVNYFFLTVLMISMALVATAGNIISFALAWELMSLSSFFLVMYEYQREATRRAGYLYLVFAQAGALFIFAAFAVAYSYTGSFAFTAFARIPPTAKLIVFFLGLIGFGSKAGVFPFHIWLPHAHPAAPSHISAVMSGVMIKMGIYGILRLYSLLQTHDLIFGRTVLSFGILSGVLGVVYALGKHDIKRLLAYHSVENIGIILIGAGIGMIGLATGRPVMAAFGFAGCLLHVLNHAIFKSLLFLGSGAILQKTKSRHIDGMGGLLRRMPVTGRTFLAGSVSISGLPPFNGFVSEFLIYLAAFQGLALRGSTLILIMLAIVSLAVIGGLAAACFTKVIGIVFLGEPRTEKAMLASECSWTMTVPMMILAACCLVIGIFPAPFIHLAVLGLHDISAPDSLVVSAIFVPAGNLALISRLILGLLVLVMALRLILYRGKEVAKAPTWGCGFTRPTERMQYTGTSYAMSLVEFFRPLVQVKTDYTGIDTVFPQTAAYASRVDDIAEISLNEGLIDPLSKVLRKLRWIQHGNIQLYIGYIVLAILVMLFFI